MSTSFDDYTPTKQVASGVIRPAAPDFNSFIDALEMTESNGGVNLYNKRTGATGPLQVTPIAFKDMGEDYDRGVEDHAYARGVGVRYAKKLWDQYKGDPRLVAAAYHTGPTQINKWLRQVPEGGDAGQFVLDRLGPEGRGHNEKTLGRLTGQLKYDIGTGRFTEANASVSFADFGDDPAMAVPKSKSLEFLKGLGGEFAALADTAFGLFTMPVTVGAQLGATAVGLASGEGNKAYAGGRKVGHKVADAIGNPLQRLLRLFDSDKAYEASKTVAGMTWLTEQIENADQFWAEKTNTPPGSVAMLADTLMVAGVGAPTAVKAARESARLKADVAAARAIPSPARKPQKNTEIMDAEIVSEVNDLSRARSQIRERAGLPKPPTFDDFTHRSTVKEADAFIEQVLKEDVAAEQAGAKAQRGAIRKGMAVGAGVGAVGVGAAAAYDKLLGRDAPSNGIEVEEPADGNEIAGRITPSEEYDSLLNQFGSLAAIPFAIGAVKGKGGMWHPEAVERLSKPLSGSREAIAGVELMPADRMDLLRQLREEPADPTAQAQRRNKDVVMIDWSKRAVHNYLNKHAGTATDPLKDVEIPFGEGVKRWEDLSDKAVVSNKGIFYQQAGDTVIANVPPNESIFEFRGQGTKEGQAISSYLSHVGDYLRQNVDPAKLQQYDLVRAVKETAQNDARVAKEMEKAAAASTKDLPVYKEYPDGMKWVELKLPKELTAEQTKLVRVAKGSELVNSLRQMDPRDMPLPEHTELYGYIALDASGKPVRNSYTEGEAIGSTPQEAWLAGKLAEEGNTMGHCVGGYCEGVASGESRIFSLRDKKGRSHVTIEVQPRNPGKIDYNKEAPPDDFQGTTDDLLKSGYGRMSDDIVQIKGKQNRAPVAEYLPYVQDFVKSGKWGDVGDIENTGLVSGKARFFKKDSLGRNMEVMNVEAGIDPRNFYTKEEIQKLGVTPERIPNGWRQVDPGPRNQQGKLEIGLAKALAVAGIGATIGAAVSANDEQLYGALMGGGGALALAAMGRGGKGRTPVQSLDYGLGVISTRLRNISEPLRFRAVEYERHVLRDIHHAFDEVHPFLKALSDVPKDKVDTLNKAILTNDPSVINKVMKEIGNPELQKGWQQTRRLLNEYGEKWQSQGRIKSLLDDYFPRIVKDLEGLKEALGGEFKNEIASTLEKANAQARNTRGSELSQLEESIIINRMLKNWQDHSGRLGPQRSRRLKDVTDDLTSFYATPTEALHSYISTVVRDMEKARFFGQDLAEGIKNGVTFIDVDTSIGNVVQRELNAGKIKPEQAAELQAVIKSRFTTGEQGATPWVQDVKNLANAGLLGNIVSAGTQFGDTILPIYYQGLRPTLAAVARQVTGNSKVNVKDFGLMDHVAEEFASNRGTQKALNNILKLSAFTAVDRFGKNILLNAALDRFQRLSKTPNGRSELAAKYGESLGQEFSTLISDLMNKRQSDTVNSVLFAELSDAQPITRMEVPQGYLDHPNGRVLYMLKTFMIKQMDVVRRDTYNEIKKGNVAKGLGNFAKYATVLGIAGATTDQIKDWMMGKINVLEGRDLWMNVLKTFGWSEYMLDKAFKQGKPMEAIIGMATPPVRMMDDILRLDPKAWSYVPVIGRLIEARILGGAQKADDNKTIKEMMRLVDPETELMQKRLVKDRNKLYNLYQRGEEEKFESGMQTLIEKYELTEKQANAIRKAAALPADVRKFKALPLAQQRDILNKLSDEQKEKYLPHAKKELRYQ